MMFRNSIKKTEEQIQEKKSEVDLDNMKFNFAGDFIGSVRFKGATFNAYSLATLMYDRPEDLLQQIRSGMKIIDGKNLKDMDDATYDALVKYGNEICSRPSMRM